MHEYYTSSHRPSLPPSLVQEDHQTQVETAQERVIAGRPVGRDFIPLSQSPQLSQLTFGRKTRRSSAELPSPNSTAVGTAVEEGSGGSCGASVKAEKQLPLLTSPPSPMVHETRGSSRLSSELTSLAVVGGAARASIDARGVSSEMTSASSRHTAMASSGKGRLQQQQQRLMARPLSNRGAAGRVKYDADSTKDDYSGSSITPASPELLYASGRITAARYHEMLAEMDGRGGSGDAAAGGTSVGISSRSETDSTATRKAAVPSQGNLGGVRRRTEPTIKRK